MWINEEYKTAKRVGCIVCPKANFTHNYKSLLRYPKLIDAFIRAKEKAPKCDWIITSDNTDYSNDKCYYICRWLNRSFRPFSKRQEKEYELVKEAYLRKHNKLWQTLRRAAVGNENDFNVYEDGLEV